MAKKKSHQQKPVFVTGDKAIHQGAVLSRADKEILDSVRTGAGLITIKSLKQLKEMAKSACERFGEFKELCSPMTPVQARVVRMFRVNKGYSWRAVAEACYRLGWGKWVPPSNQIMGMALCRRAAELSGEDYERDPWN
ncbi:hypothetical protein ES707_03631 [subsurface metagenome]